MESAIIFGKNKHLYGGLEPSHMLSFAVNSLNGPLEIACTLPEDTYVDGQLLCTVAGAIIRSKTDGYPKDEFDGDLVADVTANCVFEDVVNSADSIVYYAAFPYTDQGVYNRSKLNRALYDPDNVSYIFGYDLDATEPDPDKRVKYPDDVNNTNYSPAKMNYSTGVFDYGGWSVVTPGVAFMPRPCMLKNDGTVDYHLDPNDYTKKDDGTDSDIANVNYAGNAMIQWPKIYTKRWEENGIYHFRCSGVKHDDSWDCWCNYDKNDNEIPYFYTAIYWADNNGRSLSDRGFAVDNSLDVCRSNARKAGDDWGVETLADRLLIQDLLVMMAHSTDCQTAYGIGDVGPSSSGALNTKGLFWGSSTSSSPVKVFGMEYYWSATYRVIDGWVYRASDMANLIKITRGVHDGSNTQDYNSTGSGYISILQYNETLNGHIKNTTTTKFGRFPTSSGGSQTTYDCDSVSMTGISGTNAVYINGAAGTSLDNGPFRVVDNKSRGSKDYGTVITCKPSIS